MMLGVIIGYLCHTLVPNAETAAEIVGYFSTLTDIFLRLIKMIIAPLVFTTLVAGLSQMGDANTVGRIGVKALGWFITASLTSLFLGLLFANLMQPGESLLFTLPETDDATNLKTAELSLKGFITHLFPQSFFQAMANNEILQILVFSLFFGLALNSFQDETTRVLSQSIEGMVHVMLKITDYVMRFAPVGVFAAIASAITLQGLGILTTYGKFIGSFYFGLLMLWLILISVGYLFLRRSVFVLLWLIREPLLLAFSTASSEAAYPKVLEQMEQFGVKDKITSFVLPLGYSFNLVGSMMYQAFAVLFIAQAYSLKMSLTEQITLLLVLMISSKGMAGVPRGSLVVVAAVIPMFNLPEAGILLIMGIDQFLDMGRTATNVLGNSLATAMIAKWEGSLDR